MKFKKECFFKKILIKMKTLTIYLKKETKTSLTVYT